MSDDILETLDELHEEEDAPSLVVNEDGELMDDEFILDDTTLTEDEAQELTNSIRSTVEALYVLLARAHEGKAYEALGYSTWAEYIQEEFDFTTQRSYQLLNLATTVKEIEEAVPEGTRFEITEAQARDIKRELPRITETLREETSGKTPDEASAIIDETIDEARAQKKADDDATAKKEAELEEAREEGKREALESAADDLIDADGPSGLTDSANDGIVEMDVEGESGNLTSEDARSLYNFFTLISTFDSLPTVEGMINIIPDERETEVSSVIDELTEWFNDFQTQWESR